MEKRGLIISLAGQNAFEGRYIQDYECDPRDGSPIQKTRDCFKAKLSGTRLEGTFVSCTFRTGGNVNVKGLVWDEFWVDVSPDGNTLEGEWLNRTEHNTWQPVSFKRCPRDIDQDLAKAKSDGPAQLLSLCQNLLNQGVAGACLYPYAIVADCFGPGAHSIEMFTATGPGLPGWLLSGFLSAMAHLSGGGTLPQVPVVSDKVYRDPVMVTQDTCGPLLFLLRKAKEIMERTGVFYSDLGAQQEVIDCVQQICAQQGWSTYWP